MEISDSNQQRELLRGMFAPFDAKAWERFREWDPEAATFLMDGVRAGITDEAIRDYGQTGGYSPNAVSWLVHAAGYIRRTMAPADDSELPKSERPLARITDGTVDYSYSVSAAEAVTTYITGGLRPPARTRE